MERERIGGRLEHNVYKANLNTPTVIKTPRPTIGFITEKFFGGPEAIRKEFAEAQRIVEGTDIKIPQRECLALITRIKLSNHIYKKTKV